MSSPGGSCMNRILHVKSWRKLYEQKAACQVLEEVV